MDVKQLDQSGATDGQVLAWNNSNGVWEPETPSGGSVTMLEGDVWKMNLSYVSATTARIGTGRCRDDSDTVDMTWIAAKDAVFGSSGAGGLDTGSEGYGIFFVWAIMKADLTQAAMYSRSDTDPTMPGDYIYKRRMGAIFNDTDLWNFKQTGDRNKRVYEWWEDLTTTLQIAAAYGPGSFTNVSTLYLPTTASRIWLHVNQLDSGGWAYLRPDGHPSTEGTMKVGYAYGTLQGWMTNTSEILEMKGAAGGNANVSVLGFEDII